LLSATQETKNAAIIKAAAFLSAAKANRSHFPALGFSLNQSGQSAALFCACANVRSSGVVNSLSQRLNAVLMIILCHNGGMSAQKK